jgi:hypothetical protein
MRVKKSLTPTLSQHGFRRAGMKTGEGGEIADFEGGAEKNLKKSIGFWEFVSVG